MLFKNQDRNFILQQGYATSSECPLEFKALQFQPWVVFTILIFGIVFQSPWVFAVLSALLWWGALLPKWNIFEAIYNRTLATRPGARPLPVAPTPRRFSQGMAGTFALIISVSLFNSWTRTAVTFEVFFIVAILALVSGSLCLGTVVYHAIRGRLLFAWQTLPWK